MRDETSVDVLFEHTSYQRTEGLLGCLAVACMDKEITYSAQTFAQHQADMLAAAGLLVTAEHDAQVVRDAATRARSGRMSPGLWGRVQVEGRAGIAGWLSDEADRIADGAQP